VCMPVLSSLLGVEPSFVGENLTPLAFKGIERYKTFSLARQLIRKTQLLNSLFQALDIFIFPLSMAAHTASVKALAGAHLDSRYIATGGHDSALRVWDLQTGKCLAQYIGHSSIITWCAFSNFDHWLASASCDGTIKIWDCARAKVLRECVGHDDSVLDADLSNKDQFIVSASMDCTVRMWSTSNGSCLRLYEGHQHWVKGVRFTADNKSIVSYGLDNKLFIWDVSVTSGGHRACIDFKQGYILDCVTCIPNLIIVTSKAKIVEAYSLRTGKLLKLISEKKNTMDKTVCSMSVSPDGQLLACAVFDNTIYLYDTAYFHLQRVLKVFMCVDADACVNTWMHICV
jgi:WD40 repeat protein